MTNTTIATVGDLITALSDHDPATPVRVATEGAAWMDHTIGRVVHTQGGSDDPRDVPMVHIGTGDGRTCLPDAAASALGWMNWTPTTTSAITSAELSELPSAGEPAAANPPVRHPPVRRLGVEALATTTDFYLGRGDHAEWLGSLSSQCEPDNLLRVPPGRRALTATNESIYRAAIADLLTTWRTSENGTAHPCRTWWPWPAATSHGTDWIVTYDPEDGGVFVTIGGGVRWEPVDPHNPCEPGTDYIGSPDLQEQLREPDDLPLVRLPFMRHPGTGSPIPAGESPTSRSSLHLAVLFSHEVASDIVSYDQPLVGHNNPEMVDPGVLGRHIRAFYDQLNAGLWGRVVACEGGPQVELLLDYFDLLDLGYVTFDRAPFVWACPPESTYLMNPDD
jgi:hypothetical protein